MNSSGYINSILQNEESLLIIKKKSEISFWDYQFLGILSFFFNKARDYFIITEKKIIYVINNELIKDIEYSDFSQIKFNPLNDRIKFKNIENKDQVINLKSLRITYEEIQYLKSA